MFNAFFRLDARRIVGKAMAALEPLTPIQYTYAMHTRDLRNITPAGYIFDNQGRRLAGRFTPADVTDGSPSPLIWMFFWPMLIASVIGFVTLSVSVYFGAWIPLTTYADAWSSEVASGSSWFMGMIWAVWEVYEAMLVWNFLAAIPLLALAYLAYLVVAETEPTRMAHHYFWMLAATSFASVVFVPVLGPALGAIISIAAPWATYYVHIKALEMARHQALTEASEEAKGMTGLPDAEIRERNRKAQAESALADMVPTPDGKGMRPAPLCILGVDTGWVRRETNNALSADEGAPVGLSLGEDLSKHLFVFGGTGSGKTSGVLKPIAKAWAENQMGGGIYIDAKAGALAVELLQAGLIDKVVYPKDLTALKVNLTASMNPVFFAKAMGDVFAGESDSVWDKAARIYVMAACALVQFAAEKGVPKVKLTFEYLDRFRSNTAERERVLNILKDKYKEEILADSALRSNFTQWATSYPGLPNETRGSVDFTLDTYFKEIVSNDGISSSISGEGEDIAEMVCKGKRIGLVLSEQDGMGGVVALALIKAAIFAKLKARAQNPNWRAEGGKDVLFMVDECASLIGELDSHAASVLRSLGARMVYACQSYSQVVHKLGSNDAANAFLGNFKSILTLSAEGAGDIGAMTGTYAYVSERMSNIYRLDKNDTSIEAVALDKGVEKIRSSGIENRRLGAIGAKMSSVSTMIAEARKMLSISASSLGDRKDKLRAAASDSYQLRLMPAITANEMTALCEGTHNLVGRIERGRVGRTVVLNVRPGAAETADQRSVLFIKQAKDRNQKAIEAA